MSNRFKKHSGVFNCRICGRSTRDTNGENGDLRLCEDCFEGSMYENGWDDNEGYDDLYSEQCRVKMEECYQNAVNKGGKIKGYTKNN
jgi:hypothetical protein